MPAALLCALMLVLSAAHWLHFAYPAKPWREEPRRVVENELCPDGMGHQIDLFAAALRQEPEAKVKLRHFLATSHQSSTFLIGAAAAPFVLLGIPAPYAFALLSAVASCTLAALLWGVSQRNRCVMLLFLLHPATLRCFARPQTDALLGCFAFLAIVLGKTLSDPSVKPSTWILLALSQCLAPFIKIHALSILLIPALVAFLLGARGRRLLGVLLLGTILPLLLWTLLFQCLDLWPSIRVAWEKKNTFYFSWNAARVIKVVVPTILPLLLLGMLGRRWWTGLSLALLLVTLGFAGILVASSIPPLVRFQYPALAPLALFAGLGAFERREHSTSRWMVRGVIVLQAALVAGVLLCDVYTRYFGPTRDLGALATFLYDYF